MNVDRNKLILWSPHLSEHFIVVSSTIRLYEKRSTNATSAAATTTAAAVPAASADGSASSPYRLLDSVTYPQQSIRAVAWSPSPSQPLLVCAGLLSGKVAILRLKEDVKVVRELDPHYQRQCHALAFNPIQQQLLAVGLERQRNSPGVLVWDIDRGSHTALVAATRSGSEVAQQPTAASVPASSPAAAVLVRLPLPVVPPLAPLQLLRVHAPSPIPPSLSTAAATATSTASASSSSSTMSISLHKRSAVPVESVTEAAFRLSTSEAATSLAWHPSNPSLLAVGTGSKWLRLYDTRDRVRGGASASVVAHSRAVQGLRYDPHEHQRVASWSEDGLVKLWDHRMLTAPVLAMHSSGSKQAKARAVVEVDFCPTAPSLLATISKEEDFVRLWDLSASLPQSEEEVRAVCALPEQSDCPPMRKVRTTGGGGWLSSLSWHPLHRQRLLVVSREGMVEEMRLHDDAIAAWAPDGELCCGLDDRLDVLEGGEVQKTDIGCAMRERAMQGYALDVERNRSIARQRKEEELQRVWDWMAQSAAAGGRGAGGGGERREAADGDGGAAASAGERWSASLEPTQRVLSYDGVMAALLPPEELSRFQLDLSNAAAAHGHYTQHLAQLTSAPSASAAGLTQPLPPSASSPQSLATSASSSASAFHSATSPSPHSSTSSPASSPSSSSVYDSVMIQPAWCVPPSKVYLSDGRLSALHRCGWFDLFTPQSSTALLRRGGRPSVAAVNLETRLQGLEGRAEYEYAAMLSVFHLDLPRALHSLKLGAADERRREARRGGGSSRPDDGRGEGGRGGVGGGEDLGLVALALAGYQATPMGGAGRGASGSGAGSALEGSSLWARTFSSTLAQQPMSTPLKAIFSFLSVPHPSVQSRHTFSALLSAEPLLSFPDRLAFACRFLPDADLFAFVREAALQAIDRGQLEGLLLTGLGAGSGGVRLLQKHLDITGDVQTVALLSCFAHREGGGGGAAAGRAERWLSTYRALLNQWQLWTQRALLDVARASIHTSQPTHRPHAHTTHNHHQPGAPTPHSTAHHQQLAYSAQQQPRGAVSGHPQQSSTSTSAPAGSSSSSSPALPSAASAPHLPHVSVRCTWCGSSLALSSSSSSSSSSSAAARGARGLSSSFVRGCPHCRKSLPRCALCLLSLDAALAPAAVAHHRGPALRGAGSHSSGGTGASTPAHGHAHVAHSSKAGAGTARAGRARNGSSRASLEERGGSGSSGAGMEEDDAGGVGLVDKGAAAAGGACGASGVVGWFSWCQRCRHGGHAEHLRDWFAHHLTCPVFDCHCHCNAHTASDAHTA